MFPWTATILSVTAVRTRPGGGFNWPPLYASPVRFHHPFFLSSVTLALVPLVCALCLSERFLYSLRIAYVIPRVRLYSRGVLFGHNNLLPLIPLDYQLIYAAHHLYPSFLLITGIRRIGIVRLLSTTQGQVKR